MNDETLFQQLQSACRSDDDLKIRKVNCGAEFTVVCLDTMCDATKVCDFVLQPMLYLKKAKTLQDVQNSLATGASVNNPSNFFEMMDNYYNGYSLIFSPDGAECFAVDTRIALGRGIIEPPTSMVLRGPREGFVEDIKSNITLLRKRLKTPDFKMVNLTVGKYTNTAVSVCYVDGIADTKVVDDIVQKIQSISIDGVLDSSYLSRYLDKNKTPLFRRVGTAEKPDIVVGKMLEGRIAVLVDGSPMALTLPYLYIEDLQGPGDYYENNTATSVSRVLRLVSVIGSVLLPSLYVCLQVYNYQIIPLKFLITILNASSSIPFSPIMEMLLVLITFDILREANLRMPSAVGISLSLVGAIVLGDAAVKAGLLGAPAVMIGALSGIGLFNMSENTLVLSILRLAITFIGGMMGLLGVLLSMLALLLYLTSLENFKTPFMAPFAPDIPQDRQDAISQVALPKMTKRPRSIPNKNKKRRD